MIVRVFLFHLDADALALPALVRGSLGEAQEERRGEREVRFSIEVDDPGRTMRRTLGDLDRMAPAWRDLVAVQRVA